MTVKSNNLIPYFIPSLSSVLVAAEDKKGRPLEYIEVIDIRDNASCIMMTDTDAKRMDESRGYVDLNPENLWYGWQMLRREMERKPDIDPGPSFSQLNSKNPDYQKTINDAHSTISDFRSMLASDGSPIFEAMIKIKMKNGDNYAYIWLANTRAIGDAFQAEIFEVPKFFPNIQNGQIYRVEVRDLVDWMYNDNGKIYGGYSLRFHRSNLSKEEQIAFDKHVGASEYI